MDQKDNKEEIKKFVIKLIAITVSIIIIINVSFNTIFADKLNAINMIFSLNEKELILDDKKKGLLKSHLTKHFSYDFLERKKEGFNAPTSDWVFKNFEKIINEFKNSPSLTLSEIINFKSLLKHIKTKNKIESYSETIYSLYILNRWLNIHNL